MSADELPPEHLVRSSAKWWSRGAVTVPSLSLQRMAALVRCRAPTCACPCCCSAQTAGNGALLVERV